MYSQRSVFARLLPRTLALELGLDMHIKRVPTKENISDDPSRERYGLLQRLGVSSALGDWLSPSRMCICVAQAEYVEPALEERFVDAQAWDSLVCTAHRAWKIHAAAVSEAAVVTID